MKPLEKLQGIKVELFTVLLALFQFKFIYMTQTYIVFLHCDQRLTVFTETIFLVDRNSTVIQGPRLVGI